MKLVFQTKFMEKFFVLHYSEIGLKGKNRRFFEDKLISNIKQVLKFENFDFVKKISGRIILKLNEKSDVEATKEKLNKVFGVAYFCLAYSSSQDLEILQKDALELINKEISRLSRRNVGVVRDDFLGVTFKIETHRSKKDYPLTSQEINEKIGNYILENFQKPKLNVDLEHPGLTCFIEIVENYAFVYFKKTKGAGGLPTGTSGTIVSLISCGFDSPVASYFLMRRGAKIVFVHFESRPQTSAASVESVKDLVKKLTEYQLKSKLYLMPFLEIQKEIVKKCPLDLAVILYRRMMMRLACLIAKKEKARALLTGENLGQVASQTLENIEVIDKASNLPIFRPLIGHDKEETINLAKKISTHEISARPYEDCCSLFVSRHPKTKAKLEEAEEEEKKLEIEKMAKTALKKAKIEEFYLDYGII